MLCQFLGHDLIERLGDDLLVELLDLEPNLVGRVGEIDLTGARVEQFKLFVLGEGYARTRQGRLDPDWRLMIDEVAVDYCLAIGVAEDRLTEDFGRVQRGCRREADLHCVEVLKHAAIF